MTTSGEGSGPGRRVDLSGVQGGQVGDYNVQLNYFAESPPAGQDPDRVVIGEIPQAAPGFQPRPELMAELGAAGPGVVVARAVTGMRGVGKTQLAAAHARACIEAGWRLVAWVSAETTGQTLSGLAEIARRLDITSGGDLAETGVAVRNFLEADGDRCLVVLDNVTELGDLRRFLPAAGGCQVVVTSTRQDAAVLGTAVGVGVYTEEEALTFLAARTGRDNDPSGARELAAELGFLPLALAQAAAVIAAQHLAYPAYLDRLKTLPVREYLTPASGEPYRHDTAQVIVLSLDAAAAADPSGLGTGLLDVISLLSPTGVSRELLHMIARSGLAPADGSAAERLADEALGQLAVASLLTFSVDGTAVTVHRLISRVIREGQNSAATQAAAQAATTALAAKARSLAEPWHERAAARDTVGQILALHDHLSPSAPGLAANDEELLSLRVWALWCLNELGDSTAQAVTVGGQLAADCERVLGLDHPDTLASQNSLALAYQAAGRLDHAIQLFQPVLANRLRVLGPDHPDTLASRGDLAYAYETAGQLDQAIPMYQATLADRERVLGSDHPDTLSSRNNLAGAYESAGRLDQAIPLYRAVLTDAERVLGPDHPHTLTSRNNLAFAYRAAGQPDQAIVLYQATLTDRLRVLGPDHPGTLTSRNNLASAYELAGRLDQAIVLYQATLTDRLRVLGPDDPATLSSRNNLANAYELAGRLDQAIALHQATLTDRLRVMGPDHPDTLDSHSYLARTYQVAGRLDEAIPLFQAVLADRLRILGPDHPDTLSSRGDLAGAYDSAGRLDEATALYQATVADCERVLAANHPLTLTLRAHVDALGQRKAPGRRRSPRALKWWSRNAE